VSASDHWDPTELILLGSLLDEDDDAFDELAERVEEQGPEAIAKSFGVTAEALSAAVDGEAIPRAAAEMIVHRLRKAVRS
jgi:hypothetical protein